MEKEQKSKSRQVESEGNAAKLKAESEAKRQSKKEVENREKGCCGGGGCEIMWWEQYTFLILIYYNIDGVSFCLDGGEDDHREVYVLWISLHKLFYDSWAFDEELLLLAGTMIDDGWFDSIELD